MRGLAKAQEQQRKDLARFDGRHAAVLAERSAAEAAASDLEQRISEQLRVSCASSGCIAPMMQIRCMHESALSFE